MHKSNIVVVCGARWKVREQNDAAVAFNKNLLKRLDEAEITAGEALLQKRELLPEVDLDITRQWVCRYLCQKRSLRLYTIFGIQCKASDAKCQTYLHNGIVCGWRNTAKQSAMNAD